MESPVVEALVHIMDVYNDGKETEEERGSNEEHDCHGERRRHQGAIRSPTKRMKELSVERGRAGGKEERRQLSYEL